MRRSVEGPFDRPVSARGLGVCRWLLVYVPVISALATVVQAAAAVYSALR
ncbi:hypothetical protein ACFV1L_21340 [Kitasatospora sp. NPDC059646]